MSACAASVVVSECTMPRVSVPTWIFIPKYHCLPLPRLLHLRIARLRRILRRARRRDDRRIDDRARLEQQALAPPAARTAANICAVSWCCSSRCRKRRIVDSSGHRVLAQLDAREAAHRLAVVQHVFRLRVREIEPLLQEVHPQHRLERQRAAAATRLRRSAASTSASERRPRESRRPSRAGTARGASLCPSCRTPHSPTSAARSCRRPRLGSRSCRCGARVQESHYDCILVQRSPKSSQRLLMGVSG